MWGAIIFVPLFLSPFCLCVCVRVYVCACVHSVMSMFCDPMDYIPHQVPHPLDSPGKNTGVGCHFLFQELFLTQELNPNLLHCRRIL